MNSPNDVIVASDGAIWFSDPHYGIMMDYEGQKSEQELPCNVYRVDPNGEIKAVLTDFNCRTGLPSARMKKRLYVADTGRMGEPDPRHIRVFDVGTDWSLSGGDIFHVINPGCADGFRLDQDGNIWSSAADGVHCIAPDGHLMGKILISQTVSNVCFGGRHKHVLFITATKSVYSIALNRRGC